MRDHRDRIHGGLGGDEERAPISPCETQIGGPVGHVDRLEEGACRAINQHVAGCQVDVAVAVDFHAVGANRHKECLARQTAVAVDGVFVGGTRAIVADVEGGAVGSADEAVGLHHVADDAGDGGTGRVDIIDGLRILYLGAEKDRVGEIDAAVGCNPQVVGLVETFAVVLGGDDGDDAGRSDGNDPPVGALAGDEVTGRIEGKTVCAAGTCAEGCQYSGR